MHLRVPGSSVGCRCSCVTGLAESRADQAHGGLLRSQRLRAQQPEALVYG